MNSSKDPDCMNCHHALEFTTLCDWLKSSWVNGIYAAKRSTVFLEQEKARMPETQPVAKLVLTKESLIKDQAALQIEINILRQKYSQKAIEIRNLGPLNSEIRKTFLRKCSVDDCSGYLSTAWKCEMCDTYSCSKCFAIKGKDRDIEHVCNEDDIQSANLIRSTTKPCPGCAADTFKSEGCDQMFCTSCHTPWSWRSGCKVTGVIHNPHYHEMRNRGELEDQNTVRNPGDRQCGGPPGNDLIKYICEMSGSKFRTQADKVKIKKQYALDFIEHDTPNAENLLRKMVILDWDDEQANFFAENMYRGSQHIDHLVDELRRNTQTICDNEDLRVGMLLGRITEAQVMDQLKRRNKKRQVTQAILHVMELFSTVLQEQIRYVTRGETAMTIHETLQTHYFIRDKVNTLRDGGPRMIQVAEGTLDAIPRRSLIRKKVPPVSYEGMTAEDIHKNITTSQSEVTRVRNYCNEQFKTISKNYKITKRTIPENPANWYPRF
jgi:hypothetical protein